MAYQPTYADGFACLASRCPDTCCAGWEIVIDPATSARYRDWPGAWGEKLRRAMVTDEDGDVIFAPHDRRCPFLNELNLCAIRLALGREATSEICREHPRFTEEYEGFTEYSLSLSCPAVSRSVFFTPVGGAYPPVAAQSPDEVLNVLVRQRNAFFASFDEDRAVEENLRQLYRLSFAAQEQFALLEEPAPVWETPALPEEAGLARFGSALQNECEILTDDWRTLLAGLPDSVSPQAAFAVANAHRQTVNRALAYFVYRYFLKTVNHLDGRLTANFILMSTLMPCLLAGSAGTQPEESYRLYSKEIEHNAENLTVLFDVCAG